MGKFKDLTGLKFGKLTVIEQAGHDKYNKILWKCKCDCGKETITHGRDLVNEHCKSCGCLLNSNRKEEGRFKGLSKTRIYTIWKGMNQRCNNPNCEAYSYYGAKGIDICDEWKGTQGFFNFLAWSLENGYEKDLTIDRMDGNKGYSPSNCRWADWSTQRRNQNRTVAVNQYGTWNLKQPLPEPYRESEKNVCKDCYYNDEEVHAECVICNKTESGE
jgi:hypothetical protein